MLSHSLPLPGLVLIRPARHGDARGWFSEVWRRDQWEAAGVKADFVQDNQSFSAQTGTVRGLHFQLPPYAQAKLVRCVTGRVLDVVVDLRRSSPGFGKAVAVELTAAGGEQLFIPAGFAHGFCTLEPDSGLAYKVDAYYSAAHDRGVRWNDPAFGIQWPVSEGEAVLSAKDKVQPFFADLTDLFD
jgi:dTDP-4-dehydrorhamnose 3,5-epimerase